MNRKKERIWKSDNAPVNPNTSTKGETHKPKIRIPQSKGLNPIPEAQKVKPNGEEVLWSGRGIPGFSL